MNTICTVARGHWDGTRYVLDYADWQRWDSTLALCKGEDVAKKQMEEQTKLQKEAFAYQKGILDKIQAAFGKYITGAGEGFDPAQLSLMTSKFLDENAQTFNDAGTNVRSALAARGSYGGDMPVGGDFSRMMGTLEAAKATSQSSGVRDIRLADLVQAITNRFNAGSLMSGNAATLNSPIASFGSGASDALTNYIKAANSGFGAMFMQSLGKALGGGLGNIAIGGIGGGLKSLGIDTGSGSGG